jgi:hypothetical protein
LVGNRIITLPSLLFLWLPLDIFEQFIPFPDEEWVLKAMGSMIFEFGKAIHV